MNQEKQPEVLLLESAASEQLNHINRYFDKNWMDADYPDDKIYESLCELRRLHAENNEMLNVLKTVRDYIVLMKGRGHEYQVLIDGIINKVIEKTDKS